MVIKAYTYIYTVVFYIIYTCNLNFHMGRELNPGYRLYHKPNFISVFICIVNFVFVVSVSATNRKKRVENNGRREVLNYLCISVLGFLPNRDHFRETGAKCLAVKRAVN